ncbi:hypothetical protein N7495_006182 [Penicillium taxi]|uniref:uncharacterized protein n=1 Tax=Penicillium taxi TaxID=168475 RepID=UPI0025454C84|nr:uncharacterized protein N7495_006182 [Penicillium taxi]KAJ5894491.1 hypothetical protein N7495_006182 [Penicillium taxi]
MVQFSNSPILQNSTTFLLLLKTPPKKLKNSGEIEDRIIKALEFSILNRNLISRKLRENSWTLATDFFGASMKLALFEKINYVDKVEVLISRQIEITANSILEEAHSDTQNHHKSANTGYNGSLNISPNTNVDVDEQLILKEVLLSINL